jgi:signal transduction histidine kinase/NO-binding membrane sensor protein with MHYT domain
MCQPVPGIPVNHAHNYWLVSLSILIAIFASYTALDLARSISVVKGRLRYFWLAAGSVAMGVGVWSMHFVGMLAFSLEDVVIAYNIPLLILSVAVAILASAIALHTACRNHVSPERYIASSLCMGAGISGMHYIGIASMRMAAGYIWDYLLVGFSIAIAVSASFGALNLAFRFRNDNSSRGLINRSLGAIVMGFAVSGMHYTAMAAMSFYEFKSSLFDSSQVIATSSLATLVVGTTLFILCLALTGTLVSRMLGRRAAVTDQVTRILESITDAFFSVDKNWNFIYVNRVAKDAIAQQARVTGNLTGKSLWETIPAFKGTKLGNEMRMAMESSEPTHLEDYFAAANLWIDARIFPSKDGLSVYFQNVSDRKNKERALQEAVRSRDEFLSIASHELKTPLTSLKLQTQLRLKNIEQNKLDFFGIENLRKMFVGDSKQLDRLSRLIDDMLDISRISTGKLTLQAEHFDLCTVVAELIERYQPHFEVANCKIELQRCEHVFGTWDRFRLEQVLTNLLTNAYRYGAGKPIAISLYVSNSRAILTVRDQGIGISAEDQQRIFHRFERAVGVKDVTGLGLGLYIAKQIVEMHNGKIYVESKVGEGSTFTVELPLDEKYPKLALNSVQLSA